MQTRIGVFPAVYVCSEVQGPVTFGARDPVILLPARFLEMEAGSQQAIACHELLHVRRRDWGWTLLEEAMRRALLVPPGRRVADRTHPVDPRAGR